MGNAIETRTRDYEPSIQAIQGEVVHQSKKMIAAAFCDFDEFRERINELNAMCSRLTSGCGKKLLFMIKEGSDVSLFWKATVRILVEHWDIATGKVVSSRLLNLPQFLHIFSTIETQFVALLPSAINKPDAGSSMVRDDTFTLSILLDQMLNSDDENLDMLNECCICLEQKPNTMLECAHAFCSPCIERWRVDHESCPICRQKIETTDDTWVIPHVPNADDITQEICDSLMNLATDPK